MIAITMETRGAVGVAVSLANLGTVAHAEALGVLKMYGQLLLAKVKANANTGVHAPGEPHIPGTGPGPNIATGNYVRSINAEVRAGVAGIAAEFVVGTNAPQGRRLEFGFFGTDSLGRTYAQPPYPHFGPALMEIQPAFVAAMSKIVGGRLVGHLAL